MWADFVSITLDAPDLARNFRPGHFALARDPTTFDPYLRRVLYPLSIQRDQIQFALAASDPLAARALPGVQFDLRAPLGNPIAMDAAARQILFVFARAHILPLLFLAHHAAAEGRAVLVVARGDAAEILPAHLLDPAIEYRVVAPTDVWLPPESIQWADRIYASASLPAYAELADAIVESRYRLARDFAFAFADLPMPCGSGDCGACAFGSARGFALACQDGPFFDLADWRRTRPRD